MSGVTAAWDISNNRELKVAGPWICFHGVATTTPQPSRELLAALLSRLVECPVSQASRLSGGVSAALLGSDSGNFLVCRG